MRTKYYAFLDVVLDVFYSIILYNVFVSFPGMKIELFLIIFITFVMINYWWVGRSYNELPKYYLVDFYFITVLMFIFSLWPQYIFDLKNFLYLTSAFFLIDSIYSLVCIYAHKEKEDEKSLKFYFISELILAVTYFSLSIIFDKLNLISIFFIFLPYIIWYVVNIKRGLLKTKFVDNGNQPY